MWSRKTRGRAFLVGAIFIITLPVILLASLLLGLNPEDHSEAWAYVFESGALSELTINTGALAAMTVVLSALIGLGQATVVGLTDIQYKKTLSTLFILPLAFPLYVFAFVFVGGFSYSGQLMSFFRQNLGFDLFEYFSINSVYFVSLVFAVALAPYFFIFLSSALKQLNPRWILSARSLGHNPKSVFFKLVLGFLKPWLLSAGLFVALDVLCDFGGVAIFGFETFSLAVYQAWLSLYSLEIAVLLAFLPLAIGVGLFYLSQNMQAPGSHSPFDIMPTALFKIQGPYKFAVVSCIFIYLFVALAFPVIQLFIWLFESNWSQVFSDTLSIFFTTLGFGAITALILVATALTLLYYQRFSFSKSEKRWVPLVNIGYAIPGTIVAVGILYSAQIFEVSYSGTFAFAGLFLGYACRYNSLGFQLLEKALARISVKTEWAGQALGRSPLYVFHRAHLPLLGGSIFAALVLIVIEVIKELPLTLILRPFDVNTLATRLFQFTAEGHWEEAAFPALLIVLAGMASLGIGFGIINFRAQKQV